nr:catalase family peroxidase [uncultured Pseudomonas sp.]
MLKKYPRRFIFAAVLPLIAALGCVLFIEDSGWASSPSLSSPAGAARMVDAFEAASGPHPGFRRNHAKGLCITGQFISNGNAADLSGATFFRQGSYPVVGRLSVAGGNPSVNDTGGQLRSLALQMSAGGEAWRMALNSIPLFFVNTPQALLEQLQASASAPDTHSVVLEKMNAFRLAHPETQAFEDWIGAHRPSSGFDNAPYFSVNTFRFLSAAGHERLVRWRMQPETPYTALSDEQIEHNDPDMLTYSLVSKLAQGPVRWHLILTLALPDDPVNDATRLWVHRGHREIDAGVLVIDRQQPQLDGPCRDIDFNPLVLPAGIQPSDDPLLLARGAAYAESHRRRIEETANP